MATFRERQGRWQAIVKRSGYPTISKSFGLFKDAQRWARKQERQMDCGEWLDQSEARNTLLKELLSRYAQEVSRGKRGFTTERYRLERLKLSSLGKLSVAAISPQTLAKWRDQRLAEVSSGTVLREVQLLGHVFSVAIRDWGLPLPANPVAMMRKPSPGKPRDRVLNDRERSALLLALDSCRNPWVKPAVVFALETAARRGEILSLRWEQVNLERATTKVDGKTGPRVIPLTPACIALLSSLPRSIDGRVFPLTADALKQAYERSVERAKLVDLTFHDLRHDALTRLAKIGLSVLELRAISGHTSANMLQRYVSIDPADLALKLAGSP